MLLVRTKQKAIFSYLIIQLLLILPLTAQITVDRFMGVNTLREDPVEKMKAVGFIREYHSWYLNEGNPSLVLTDYSPSYPNAIYRWNKTYQDLSYTRFDEFYKEIRNVQDIHIAPSFIGNLFQIVDPDRYTSEGDNNIIQEQIPIANGANSLDPASYKAHGAYLFQYAARYGHQVFPSNTFNNLIVPKTHPEEVPQTGLGIVEYMESWNEQDKWWWQDNYPNTYFTPQQYTAMLSADYDGHGNTLGAGIGIKNADPNMKVVMGGLARADLGYIREMVAWAKANRGPLGGSVEVLPFNVLNIHHYIGNNENFLHSSQGVSPEHAGLREFLKTFDAYRDSLNMAMGTNLELWLSEFGYDTYLPGSTGQPIVTAPQIGSNDSYEVQGQWITRIYLEALAAEIDRAMLFFLRDEQTPYNGLYSSSGLLESAANNHKPKNSWFYTYTMKNVLTDMVFDADVSPCSDTTCVRVYRFKEINNGAKKVYAIWSPTSSAKIVNYHFNHEDVQNAQLVQLELPSIWGNQSTISQANPSLSVSEKPMFIIKNGNYFTAPSSCAANPMVENPTCGSLNVRINAMNANTSYQLWHMPGTSPSLTFDHQSATLVNEAISASDSVITVTGLQANQSYTFFLFPEGISASETSKICTTTGSTTNSTCKIIVDPSWIYDDYKNHINSDGLFDNQNDFDPMCNPNEGFPSQNDLWGFNFDMTDSMSLSLDLQNYYHIDAFTLHDEGSRGFFTIQIADSPNGPWTTVTDYLTIAYNKWVTLANVIPAHKPIRYLKFIAEKNDAAKVGELYICGRLSDYNPDILPGVGVNGLVKNITCESLDLEWKHPFDDDIAHYKVLENNIFLENVPFEMGTQTHSISNRTELTNYNYAIITVDYNGQESTDTLKLSATTLGGISQCIVPLNTSMIFDYFEEFGNAEKLVDQQGTYDPLCNPYTVPNNLWGADYTDFTSKEHVSIDLQGYYDIDDIILHDGGGNKGQIKVFFAHSPNGPWINVITYDAVKFNDWITFNEPIPNDQLVRFIRFEASEDNHVATGEVFICGTLDPSFNPDLLPGVGTNGSISNLSCDSVHLKWDAPLDNDIKEYKIIGGPNPVFTDSPEIIIKNLQENTNYIFKIITIDNALNESTDTLRITATTYITGECSVNCNLTCPCAICIRPSWLTNIQPTMPSGQFDSEKLVNEQDLVPFCGSDGSNINQFWGYSYNPATHAPAEVEIDLQSTYEIDNFHFFARGGGTVGYVEIDYKDENAQWVRMANDSTGGANGYAWRTYENLNITTQYFRIRLLDDNAGIGEIGICGQQICPDIIDLPNPISASSTFQANMITSSASLGTGLAIEYLAETSITLKQGFHAVAGVDFLARIEDCANNFLNQEAFYSFSTIETSNQFSVKDKLEIYPNPFYNSTTISYHIATPAPVKLDIYDTDGKIIKNLVNNQLANQGKYQTVLSKEIVASGFYIARITIGDEVYAKKLVVLD